MLLFLNKIKLNLRVHHVLSTLSITHFICYGSLWGQIRISRSLPWEVSSQFCLRNEELIPLDEVYIIRAFDKHGLEIKYNSAEGIYNVIDPYINGAFVELYVFEEDKLVRLPIFSSQLWCDNKFFLDTYVSSDWLETTGSPARL